MSKGVEAFSVVWPVLTIPLFVGILWVLFEKWYIPMLDRMSAKAFADRFPEFRDAEVDNTKPPPTN
jgi:hypothetical protein